MMCVWMERARELEECWKMAEICSGKIKVEAVGEKCHGRNARTPPGAHGAEICLVFVRFNEIFWT